MAIGTDLSRIVPGIRVSDAAPDRLLYARDLWPRQLIRLRAHQANTPGPACVVWPSSAEEVQRIVQYACETRTPVVPFGAGSGVCGAVEPDAHTIVMDLKRFDDWRISDDGAFVDVGAGMLGITLENELGAEGYTVGHFPSSILCSTAGGWVAARGAGQCSGLYGKIEDMVVGLDTVLGNGERVDMHSRPNGPDLVPLVIGSEGTLGVVTRARFRLHPRPQGREFLAFAFETFEQGCEALREVYQQGLRPSVARLYDALDTALVAPKAGSSGSGQAHGPPSFVLKAALRVPRAINRVVEAIEGKLLKRCQLILIFEGPAAEIRHDTERANQTLSRRGGDALGDAPARAWYEHRYSVSYRQSPIFRMGAFSDTMEVAAPWSKLMDVYRDVRRALGKHVVVLAHLSHAYPDGSSIYFTFSARARDDDEALLWYDELWPEALTAALEAGATLSHHHGVGRSKAPVLGTELGYGVGMVRRLMSAWDPAGIMNPGALVPADGASTASDPPAESGACHIDDRSLFADLDANLTLDEAENLLVRRGLTLGTMGEGMATLGQWLALGLPGTRSHWEDPVDHVLVTLRARVGQRIFQLPPAPRRAVGPDLLTFFRGESRVGRVERVTLRVHPIGSPRARALKCDLVPPEGPNGAEVAAWERAIEAVRV